MSVRMPGKRRTAPNRGGVALPLLCRALGLPEPIPEHVFHPTRKWRFDWAWVDLRVALEVDGGVWIQGRHTRASGWLKDTEKINSAAALGWRLFRATPQQVESGAILDTLRPVLAPEAIR